MRSRSCAARNRSLGLRREVRRRNVAGDLVHRLDVVLPQPLRVLADDLFARRRVDAERHHTTAVRDHDVAVLPRDLGELLLGELARPPPDGGHLALADVEMAFDQISGLSAPLLSGEVRYARPART